MRDLKLVLSGVGLGVVGNIVTSRLTRQYGEGAVLVLSLGLVVVVIFALGGVE
jgi:predicted MFS family arabinose efflux permease